MGQTAETNVHELPEASTIDDIQVLSRIYNDARNDVVELVSAMESEIDAVKRKHMRSLKARVAKAKEKGSDLLNTVADNPELFDKPKSIILHGIKSGFRKKSGQLSWGDDAYVCDKIKTHFPKQKDVLIKTTEKPVDKALRNLQAGDLLKLGVTLGKDTEEAFIASVDSEVDKLVEALMQDSEKYE